MTGPIINSCGIVFGGVLGFLLKRFIPKRVEEGLTPTFALIAVGIGISMIIKVYFFPVVALALIFGRIIGDLLNLEMLVGKGALLIQHRVNKIIPHKGALHPDEISHQFSALLVLFCVSGLGILGALTEGLSGDYQLLVIKSILDFFTAIIFAVSLGISVTVLAVPQLLVQSSLFLLAKAIMPVMDDIAYADFSACGGIIMIALGLRIAGIKHFAVMNLVPALFLVLPLSYMWRFYFG